MFRISTSISALQGKHGAGFNAEHAGGTSVEHQFSLTYRQAVACGNWEAPSPVVRETWKIIVMNLVQAIQPLDRSELPGGLYRLQIVIKWDTPNAKGRPSTHWERDYSKHELTNAASLSTVCSTAAYWAARMFSSLLLEQEKIKEQEGFGAVDLPGLRTDGRAIFQEATKIVLV